LNSYSDGKASLNLRGLGENRTLPLVDGRRLTPVNPPGGDAAANSGRSSR